MFISLALILGTKCVDLVLISESGHVYLALGESIKCFFHWLRSQIQGVFLSLTLVSGLACISSDSPFPTPHQRLSSWEKLHFIMYFRTFKNSIQRLWNSTWSPKVVTSSGPLTLTWFPNTSMALVGISVGPLGQYRPWSLAEAKLQAVAQTTYVKIASSWSTDDRYTHGLSLQHETSVAPGCRRTHMENMDHNTRSTVAMLPSLFSPLSSSSIISMKLFEMGLQGYQYQCGIYILSLGTPWTIQKTVTQNLKKNKKKWAAYLVLCMRFNPHYALLKTNNLKVISIVDY